VRADVVLKLILSDLSLIVRSIIITFFFSLFTHILESSEDPWPSNDTLFMGK